MNDEAIIKLAASGDRRAMERLAELSYPPVAAFCRKLTHSSYEAQDLAQAVMLRMIEKIGQYRDRGSSFRSWLFSIAYHLFIDGTRKRTPRPVSGETFLTLADPGDPYGEVHHGDHVRQLMDALSDELRAMVVLRYSMDLSYAEIARAMDTSEKRVKWRLNDALERMRKAERQRGGGE